MYFVNFCFCFCCFWKLTTKFRSRLEAEGKLMWPFSTQHRRISTFRSPACWLYPLRPGGERKSTDVWQKTVTLIYLNPRLDWFKILKLVIAKVESKSQLPMSLWNQKNLWQSVICSNWRLVIWSKWQIPEKTKNDILIKMAKTRKYPNSSFSSGICQFWPIYLLTEFLELI